MTLRVYLVAAVLLIATAVSSQDNAKLERTVNGGTLTSKSDPAVELTVNQPLVYVGGQVIDIKKVAGAEQHFFVEATADKHIRRFCWIQFEHYYSSNNYSYDYSGISGQQPIRIGSMELLADAKISPEYFTSGNSPGSDSGAAVKFLESKGYKLDGSFVRVRMFHLTDASKRKELMVIYGEALPEGASEETVKSEAMQNAGKFVNIR